MKFLQDLSVFVYFLVLLNICFPIGITVSDQSYLLLTKSCKMGVVLSIVHHTRRRRILRDFLTNNIKVAITLSFAIHLCRVILEK